MFSILYKGQIVGVVLYTFHPNGIVELKNIAITKGYQGKGIGKLVVKESFDLLKNLGLQQMIVGMVFEKEF